MSARSLSTRSGPWFFRLLRGHAMGGTASAPVVMLTVPGRRTGQPRSVCVRAIATADGWLVWGTASGAPRDPDWFRNLRAAGRAQLVVGSAEPVAVTARELTGAEREAAWHGVVLSQLPRVARYAAKAGRVIPLAVLSPQPGRGPQTRS